jgi:PAS domain S-box-containing protein
VNDRGSPSQDAKERAIGREVTHILADSAALDEATPRLLAHLGETFGWDAGAIWEAEGDEEVLRCIGTWQASGVDVGQFEELSRKISFAPGVGLPGRVWADGEPVWVADVTREPNFPRAKAAAEVGLRGALGFPIPGADGILGVIEFYSRKSRKPDLSLVRALTSFGTQIGWFIDREKAEEEARTSLRLRTAMLESMPDPVIAMDHEGLIVEFNPAAEGTFGYSREQAIGAELAELVIPAHLRERHRRALARYLAGGGGAVLGKRMELPGMRSDGSEFPAELTITRIGEDDPPMFMGSVRDVSDRKRDEEELQFLVRASDALDESLDLDTTLHTLARLAVPYLADGCMVDLRNEDGSISRAASAATDATYEPVLDELRRHKIDPNGPHPIASAMRSGHTEIVPDITDPFRRDISASEDYYQALLRWPARSVVVVPMKVRGKILGTMSLASFSLDRSYGAHEMSVIEELARRAANAVENARLFDERTRLARTLRQSLLPPRLPELPGAEVAARFQPAGASNEVGGDFYDVFGAGDSTWAIAIGDVSGRGVEAAATTALARHSIRAAAIQGASPAAILTVLNEALLSQPLELRLCTAAVGLLAVGAAGARLSLASAGHPPPILLHADGSVETIGSPGTLLGAISEPVLGETEVNLAVGDSVVFYTDGLTGTGSNGQRLELDELTSVIESCVDLDASTTAQSIDDALLETRRAVLRDDAAILVVRVLEPVEEPAAEPGRGSDEGDGWVRTRRLAWSRLAGRGDAPDRPPSARGEKSDLPSEDE